MANKYLLTYLLTYLPGALYIHNSLVFKNFDEISDPNVESVSAKIKVGNHKPFIVT